MTPIELATMVVHKTPRAKKLIHRLVRGEEKVATAGGTELAATVGDRVNHCHKHDSKARHTPLPPPRLARKVDDDDDEPSTLLEEDDEPTRTTAEELVEVVGDVESVPSSVLDRKDPLWCFLRRRLRSDEGVVVEGSPDFRLRNKEAPVVVVAVVVVDGVLPLRLRCGFKGSIRDDTDGRLDSLRSSGTSSNGSVGGGVVLSSSCGLPEPDMTTIMRIGPQQLPRAGGKDTNQLLY